MKQKILIILSIFFVLLVVYFFTFANTKDEPDKIEISAVDLWKEFDYNADAATQNSKVHHCWSPELLQKYPITLWEVPASF